MKPQIQKAQGCCLPRIQHRRHRCCHRLSCPEDITTATNKETIVIPLLEKKEQSIPMSTGCLLDSFRENMRHSRKPTGSKITVGSKHTSHVQSRTSQSMPLG
jgi:hypothetical protein